jgi:hypothetical protein
MRREELARLVADQKLTTTKKGSSQSQSSLKQSQKPPEIVLKTQPNNTSKDMSVNRVSPAESMKPV